MLDEAIFAEQADLRNTLRSMLSKQLAPLNERVAGEARAAATTTAWRQLVDLGAPGLGTDEDQGGVGGGLAELAVVSRELGRALAPVSISLTAGLASELARRADDGVLLRALCEGERLAVAVAPSVLAGPTAPHELGISTSASGVELNGTIDVLDLEVASRILVVRSVVGGDGDGAWIVDVADLPELAARPLDTVPGMRSVRAVELAGTRAEPLAVDHEAVVAAFTLTRVLLAYEMLGAAEAVIESGVEHARAREQFGRPIGSFQAVQHRLATAFIELQVAAGSASLALRSADGSHGRGLSEVARASAARALVAACEEVTQVVGAIGYTWEFSLHHYVKYAKFMERLLGDRALELAVASPAGWSGRGDPR